MQEFRKRLDFIGFPINFDLSQDQPMGSRPGTDPVNGVLAQTAVMRATECFAINRYHLTLGEFAHGAQPIQKATLELLRIQSGKDPSEGIGGWNAIGQSEKLFQPFLLGGAPRLDLHPSVRTTDDGADGDDKDINQKMLFRTSNSWVLCAAKCLAIDG